MNFTNSKTLVDVATERDARNARLRFFSCSVFQFSCCFFACVSFNYIFLFFDEKNKTKLEHPVHDA